MNPILQEKINKLKQEEQEQKDKKAKEEAKTQSLRQKQIKSKIPEAKVWIESTLLDLIAKEDIRIEAINKNKTGWKGDTFFPKEIYLSEYKMIPPSIPVEAVVEAIKEFDGLSVRSSWTEEYNAGEGISYPACWNYYVQW